jgi:outer membrane protein OmpA-like peptidoglycan-associated protein
VTTVPKPVPAEVRTTTPTPAPVEPRPRPAAKASALPGEVYFGVNSAELSGQATSTLAKAVRWLNENSDAQVIIEGHADPSGNPDANMALAQKRAELVRDQLVSAGIDASRIEVVSLGDTRVKYGRTDGRNRRVAFVKK